MNDEQIERLGVSAIGDRVRLRTACRDFKEGSAGVSNDGGRSVATTSTRGRPSAEGIREERMRLFNPEAPVLNPKTGKLLRHEPGLFSLSTWQTGISTNTIGHREANLT